MPLKSSLDFLNLIPQFAFLKSYIFFPFISAIQLIIFWILYLNILLIGKKVFCFVLAFSRYIHYTLFFIFSFSCCLLFKCYVDPFFIKLTYIIITHSSILCPSFVFFSAYNLGPFAVFSPTDFPSFIGSFYICHV